MIRRLALIVAFSGLPATAMAETMPQMDFKNPLTSDQVIWMVVILVALYLVLARWGLPQMGAVLENRATIIRRDLEAARAAKAEADAAVKAMDRTMSEARRRAQAEIAEAVAAAKAAAAADLAAMSARLDKQLAESEAQIAEARRIAMTALRPVAEETATAIMTRLTGAAPEHVLLTAKVGQALDAKAA